MDGIKAFITRGPESGTLVEPNLLLASRDRVALALSEWQFSKLYVPKAKVGQADIFEQDQLKRAVELGFGVKSADDISLTPLNDESKRIRRKIEKVLKVQITNELDTH